MALMKSHSLKVCRSSPLQSGSAKARCTWESLGPFSVMAEGEAPGELPQEPREWTSAALTLSELAPILPIHWPSLQWVLDSTEGRAARPRTYLLISQGGPSGTDVLSLLGMTSVPTDNLGLTESSSAEVILQKWQW